MEESKPKGIFDEVCDSEALERDQARDRMTPKQRMRLEFDQACDQMTPTELMELAQSLHDDGNRFLARARELAARALRAHADRLKEVDRNEEIRLVAKAIFNETYVGQSDRNANHLAQAMLGAMQFAFGPLPGPDGKLAKDPELGLSSVEDFQRRAERK